MYSYHTFTAEYKNNSTNFLDLAVTKLEHWHTFSIDRKPITTGYWHTSHLSSYTCLLYTSIGSLLIIISYFCCDDDLVRMWKEWDRLLITLINLLKISVVPAGKLFENTHVYWISATTNANCYVLHYDQWPLNVLGCRIMETSLRIPSTHHIVNVSLYLPQ